MERKGECKLALQRQFTFQFILDISFVFTLSLYACVRIPIRFRIILKWAHWGFFPHSEYPNGLWQGQETVDVFCETIGLSRTGIWQAMRHIVSYFACQF